MFLHGLFTHDPLLIITQLSQARSVFELTTMVKNYSSGCLFLAEVVEKSFERIG